MTTFRSRLDPALADALTRHEARIAELEAAGAVDLSDFAQADDSRLDIWQSKRVVLTRTGELGSGSVTGTRLYTPGIQTAGPWLPTLGGVSTGITHVRLDPARLPTLAGKTKKVWVVGTLVTNAVAPLATFTFELRPVATFGGASAATPTVATVGSVVASAAIAAPSASNGGQVVEGVATYPAAGFYVPSLTNSVAAMAANSSVATMLTLLEGWV